MRLSVSTVAVTTGCLVTAGLGGYLAVRSGTETVAVERATTTTIEAPAAPRETAPLASAQRDAPPAPTRAARTRQTDAARPAARPATPAVAQATGEAPAAEPVAPPAPIEEASVRPAPATTESAPVPTDASEPRSPLVEVELAADTVIGVRLETSVSSETSQVEDRVTGRVTRDVLVDNRVVVPAGAELAGHVASVQRGGKLRERARIGIRFTSLAIGDVRVPIQTEAIYRDGDSPGGEATAKIGASAVIGSILGGMVGGGKGAAIGGAAGAAGGTAVVMKGDRNAAAIAAGTPLTVRLAGPAAVGVAP